MRIIKNGNLFIHDYHIHETKLRTVKNAKSLEFVISHFMEHTCGQLKKQPQASTVPQFSKEVSQPLPVNSKGKMQQVTGQAKLLQQCYRYHKLRKTFSKFCRRHFELISKFNGVREGLSEPEFYGDLVYKFKKLI